MPFDKLVDEESPGDPICRYLDTRPFSRFMVIHAPGGASSNIFQPVNGVNGGSEGSDLNSIDSGSLSSLPSTPVNGMNGSTNGHFFGDTMSECSTPPSSASSSRRGSRQEDTKNRLFGPELESPRRRVVDRMKSNIFTENSAPLNGNGGLVRSASVKKYDFGLSS
ncbi:unnamed protein product [Oppiella nova]|uniref:Uncharacterized protein n=1 Tax=Oppiella nova TaxID=334625 RepID=A0A7R9QR35_9ACAR|nr:unnamed protein product [Oppiella nova]CAG2170718.1 unnamed protein product [Oppiella nova]